MLAMDEVDSSGVIGVGLLDGVFDFGDKFDLFFCEGGVVRLLLKEVETS